MTGMINLGIQTSSKHAASASPALTRGLRGFRLCMLGRYTRGLRHLHRALQHTEDAPSDRAEVLMLIGLAERSRSEWTAAKTYLMRAAEQAHTCRSSANMALALALAVDALACSGHIREATEGIQQIDMLPQSTQRHLDLAVAVLKLYTNEPGEALVRAEAAWEWFGGTSSIGPWLMLYVAHARGAIEDFDGALRLLEDLIEACESHHGFSEAYVAALVNHASIMINNALNGGNQGTIESARRSIQKARRYAVNFERYRVQCDVLDMSFNAIIGFHDEQMRIQDIVEELMSQQYHAPLSAMLLSQTLSQFISRDVSVLLERSDEFCRRVSFSTGLLSQQKHTTLEVARATVPNRKRPKKAGTILETPLIKTELPGYSIELDAVFQVTRALSSVLDPDELMDTLLKHVVRVFNAERGIIFRTDDDDRVKAVAALGIDPDQATANNREISFTAIKEAMATNHSVLSENTKSDTRYQGSSSVLAADIRSLLCSPLSTQKSRYGVLYLDSRINAHSFSDMHRDLLQVFSTHAAIALENATAFTELAQINRDLETRVASRTEELNRVNQTLQATVDHLKNTRVKLLEAEKSALEKEMKVAERIQQTVIPDRKIFTSPAASVYGIVAPASKVGGDFWTFKSLDKHRDLLMIADVSGHGVGAGMVTAAVKACLTTLIDDRDSFDLVHCFRTLSRVVEEFAGEMHMTAFACILDARSSTMHYLNAGHPPPVRLAHGGNPVSLPTNPGHLLGNSVSFATASGQHELAPGERLILFTDGLLELENPSGRSFGGRRLYRALAKASETSEDIRDIVGAIHHEASRFAEGSEAKDDITIVAIERR